MMTHAREATRKYRMNAWEALKGFVPPRSNGEPFAARQAGAANGFSGALRAGVWTAAALLLASPSIGLAQQTLSASNPAVAVGGLIGSEHDGADALRTGCSAGFPVGLAIWEKTDSGAGGGFPNLDGGVRAARFNCANFTVTQGASAATIAFGAVTQGSNIGRSTTDNTQRGPSACPAGQVIAELGGYQRRFTGGSGNLYPTQVAFRCRPVTVVAGDWFNTSTTTGAGTLQVLGTLADGDAANVPGAVSAYMVTCPQNAGRTCNGMDDHGGGLLIDGYTGAYSTYPNARVSQRLSFVNYAWNQTTGASTDTAAWRPGAAGVLFYPTAVANNAARYQQAYESYVHAGVNYSGSLSAPAGTLANSYSRTGTCATPRTLAVNEDYTCTNIVTGRPDLQVGLVQPDSAWTSHGQFKNLTLTARNFGSAATTGTDNSTAVLTLPAGWDAGTLPVNCTKAGSPVVVTCQVNPTPLAASSGPGVSDGGEVDFVIPVTPLAGVATGSYPVPNGAKVCVQAATPGQTHVCTVPADANANNEDGINVNETATLVLAYQTPPLLPPAVTTTVVSVGGAASFSFAGTNNAAPVDALVTPASGVGETAPTQYLTTVGTSTTLTQVLPPAGYSFTGATCTGLPPGGVATVAPALRRVTFNAAAVAYGANIACTFTNTRVAVTVAKVSTGGVGTFEFSGTNGFADQNVATVAADTPVSAPQQGLDVVGAATTITESVLAGWRLSGVSCSGMGTGGTATPSIAGNGANGGSVTLNAAATTTGSVIGCTFTNIKLPTVTVRKISIGGVGSFAFSGTNGIDPHDIATTVAGAAAAGETQILTAESVATSLTEAVPPAGFALTGLSCTGIGAGGTATSNLATRTVALNAAATAPGSDIVCTFTNTAISALKLVKTASDPAFTVGVAGSYTLTLTNTSPFASTAVTTITDTVPAALTLGTMPVGCTAAAQVVTCSVPAGLPAVTGSAAFVIPVTPLATAIPSVSNTALANGGGDPLCVGTGNCTSTVTTPVRAQPTVTVRKLKTNVTGTQAFGYTLTGVTNPTDTVSVVTTNIAVASTVVHTGAVGVEASITESTVPTGWPANPAAVSCLDAAAATSGNPTTNVGTLVDATVTLPASVMRAGANITCTFTNTARPVLTLAKTATATVVPGGAIAYGLSLTNSGAIATGTTVVVREQLPSGVLATSVVAGTGITLVNCGTLPSAAGAALSCTLTLPAAGIPAGATRSFTLAATAPSTAALAATGTVLTNHANTNVSGSGVAATAPGAGCTSDATVSCANAVTTIVAGPGAVAQSGVRTVTDNQLADGSAQDVLEALVRDAAQNPVTGAVVNFVATASVAFNGGTVGAAGSCTTNAAGTCQVTATSTLIGARSSAVSIAAGTLTGAFTAGGNAYHASPATYSFLLGAPSAAMSGLRVVTDNALANGTAQDVLQVLVRDAGGNPVGAGTVVSFGATPNVAFNGGAVGAAGTCTTAATGLCQVTATSAVAAIYGATPVTIGGAAVAGTFTASGNNYLPSPQPYRFGAMPTVTFRKISLNAIGTFDFTGTNGVGAQSITTLVAGTPTAGITQTLTAPNTAMTLTEAVPPAGFTLTTASCSGMGTGGTATLGGRVLSLNAAATAPGSNIVCTFTNTGSTIEPPPIPPTIMCTTNAAVFNTGYGPNGRLTSGRDTVWESGEGTPTGGPTSVANWQRSYVGNQAPGAWIDSPFGNANWNSNYTIAGHVPNVDVYHRFTFNLASSVTPTSFSLKLDFYSDNSVAEVFVNGVLQTVPGVPQNPGNPYYHAGFVAGAAASATLSSNWRTGTNTVVVHVKSGPNAEGFLAQTTTTAVCAPPTVTLSKTTTGGAGGPFNFSLTNTAQTSGTAATAAAGTQVQVDGSTATAGLQAFTATAVGTAVTITEAAAPGWNLASASCTDGGTPVGSLGTGAAARTYTIPAASVQYGRALQCLFTNSASATVTVRKVSIGNAGTFGFTGDNGLAAQSIVTATAGTAVAAGIQTLAAPPR